MRNEAVTETSVVHSTFVIEQPLSAAPERVFRAFAEPDRKQIWYAQGEKHSLQSYSLDFRVGGVERWLATFNAGTPFAGAALESDTIYLDIVTNARIVMAQDMRLRGYRFSVALITIELAPDGGGTRLHFTHQGAFFEGADGPEIREEGWRKLLDKLAAEVEASVATH